MSYICGKTKSKKNFIENKEMENLLSKTNFSLDDIKELRNRFSKLFNAK